MKVVLGLGTNLGNRENNLAKAWDLLEKVPQTEILKISNVYETEPFDVISQQDPYLNCCVLLETKLQPKEMLEHCFAIENALGRQRTEYHGARTMDVDILLWEGVTSKEKELMLPHPGILERAFVMVPLSDLFPTWEGLGFSFAEAYKDVDKSGVKLYK